MTDRLAVPGRAFVEQSIALPPTSGQADDQARVAMSEPSVTDDGWWLAHLWAADDHGVLEAAQLLPPSGPPPGPPLATIGPRLAGALSGLIAEEAGRQMIRLRMPPAADEARAWERPVLCMVAIRWDPVRAEVLTRDELAGELLHAFALALEAIR